VSDRTAADGFGNPRGTPWYLPELRPEDTPPDPLYAEYWDAAREGRLALQRCSQCRRFQWGPEWICHRCHSLELSFEMVEPNGAVFSWERVWHPQHPALAAACPYLVVVVELRHADGARLLGNLLGDPCQEVAMGMPVEAVFEHHDGYSLVQWRPA
jgi:uncharacterized OB-fold protein